MNLFRILIVLFLIGPGLCCFFTANQRKNLRERAVFMCTKPLSPPLTKSDLNKGATRGLWCFLAYVIPEDGGRRKRSLQLGLNVPQALQVEVSQEHFSILLSELDTTATVEFSKTNDVILGTVKDVSVHGGLHNVNGSVRHKRDSSKELAYDISITDECTSPSMCTFTGDYITELDTTLVRLARSANPLNWKQGKGKPAQPAQTQKKPPPTTKPPIITTTKPPIITTKPPMITTKPPIVTTKPPMITTKPPIITTKPPMITTKPPIITTKPPIITTTKKTTAVVATKQTPSAKTAPTVSEKKADSSKNQSSASKATNVPTASAPSVTSNVKNNSSSANKNNTTEKPGKSMGGEGVDKSSLEGASGFNKPEVAIEHAAEVEEATISQNSTATVTSIEKVKATKEGNDNSMIVGKLPKPNLPQIPEVSSTAQSYLLYGIGSAASLTTILALVCKFWQHINRICALCFRQRSTPGPAPTPEAIALKNI